MKQYIAVGVVLALLGIAEAAVDLNQVRLDCADKLTVTKDEVTTYINQMINDESPDAISKESCYMACTFIESGLWRNGTFDLEITDLWYEGVSQEMMDTVNSNTVRCSSGENAEIENPCARTYDFMGCCMQVSPQVFFQSTTPFVPVY